MFLLVLVLMMMMILWVRRVLVVGSGRYRRHFRTMVVYYYYYFAEEGVGGEKDWVTMSLVVSVLFPGRADPLPLVPGYDNNNNWETFTRLFRFLLDTLLVTSKNRTTLILNWKVLTGDLLGEDGTTTPKKGKQWMACCDFDFIIYVPRGRREMRYKVE